MSLEAALQANTEALNKLTAALAAAGLATHAEQPAAEATSKPAVKRATKEKTAEKTEAQKQAAGEGATVADRTYYFFTEKHDTVYAVQAGEPLVITGGAVEITEAEYTAHRARIEQKYHQPAGNAAAATETAPAAAAATTTSTQAAPSEVSLDELMAKVKPLSERADGRDHMVRILGHFGVPKFSLLAGQKRGEALEMVKKALGE